MERARQQQMMQVFWRRVLILVLLVVTFFLIRGVWSVYDKEREAAGNRAEEEAQLAELAARESQLQDTIERLGSERGVEEVLRKQYGMVRPGEGVVILLDATATSPIPAPESSWWEKLWGWLPL